MGSWEATMVLARAFKVLLLLVGPILALSISPVLGNPSPTHHDPDHQDIFPDLSLTQRHHEPVHEDPGHLEAAARHHEPGHGGDLSDLEVAPRHHHPEHDHPSEEEEGKSEENDSGTPDMVMTNNKQLDDQDHDYDPGHHDVGVHESLLELDVVARHEEDKDMEKDKPQNKEEDKDMEDMEDMDMEMDTDMALEKQLDKQVHGPDHTGDSTLKGPLPGYEVISDVLRSIIHPPIPVTARHHDCKHHDCGHHRVFSDVDVQHGRHLYDVDVQLGKQVDDGPWNNRLPGHEVFSDVPQGIIHPLPREQMYEARNLSLSSALAGAGVGAAALAAYNYYNQRPTSNYGHGHYQGSSPSFGHGYYHPPSLSSGYHHPSYGYPQPVSHPGFNYPTYGGHHIPAYNMHPLYPVTHAAYHNPQGSSSSASQVQGNQGNQGGTEQTVAVSNWYPIRPKVEGKGTFGNLVSGGAGLAAGAALANYLSRPRPSYSAYHGVYHRPAFYSHPVFDRYGRPLDIYGRPIYNKFKY